MGEPSMQNMPVSSLSFVNGTKSSASLSPEKSVLLPVWTYGRRRRHGSACRNQQIYNMVSKRKFAKKNVLIDVIPVEVRISVAWLSGH